MSNTAHKSSKNNKQDMFNNEQKSNDEDNFTLPSEKSRTVRPTTSTQSPAWARAMTLKTNTNEPWMNRYTTSTFNKAHALLYPIPNTLVSLPEQNQ